MNGAALAGVIEVRGLHKRFGANLAVCDLNFTVQAGEIFGLVGPDGSGKTTTLRMLASVMRPDAGSIAIDGVDVLAQPEQAKQHVSYMPQRFGLYEDLTVQETSAFMPICLRCPKALGKAAPINCWLRPTCRPLATGLLVSFRVG